MPNEVLGFSSLPASFPAGSRLIPRRTRSVLSQYQLQGLLVRTDVILPKKRHYIIETNATQYARAHHEKDLKIVRQIISERTPAYLSTFDHVMRQRSGHRFNMMIMKRTQLDAYCSWLFPILEEAENGLTQPVMTSIISGSMVFWERGFWTCGFSTTKSAFSSFPGSVWKVSTGLPKSAVF